MKKLAGIIFAIALCVMVQAPQVQAATTTPTTTVTSANVSSLLETLKSLMAQVEVLRAELAKIKGVVRDMLKDGLVEGATHEDIKKIQEILASDSAVYPEGKVTGYFGPLTKEALRRFQAKFKLEVTGQLDSETEAALETLLEARFGTGKVPPGLLTAPGLQKKFEDRLKFGCDNSGPGKAPFCLKIKQKYKFEDAHKDEDEEDEEDDEDDEDADDTDEYEVEVKIKDGKTIISFNYDGDDYTVKVSSTSQSVILAKIADELDMSLAEVEDALVDEIKEELKDALADDKDTGTKDDAKAAISDAKAAIDAVQKDINKAGTGVDVDDAQAELDDAKELLKDAEDAFDDADWSEAEDLASDAEDGAEDAANELEDAEDAA